MLACFRKPILIFTTTFLANFVFAQMDIASIVNDEWYKDIGSKGLKVGDPMPDVPFGAILNNNTGKTRFSELKGKAVILDFWHSSCSSCILKFPEMEKLQKQFGEDIVIILVNPFETEEQIRDQFKRFNGGQFKMYNGKKISIPNLPTIVSEKPYTNENVIESPIFRLFPHRERPHHVWIDKNGVVRLIGGGENTYSEKIKALLKGEPIFVLNSSANVPVLWKDMTTPYYKLLGNFKDASVKFGSIIMPFNNEIDKWQNEIFDSAGGVKISYFINNDLLDIYLNGPFKEFWKQIRQDIIYAPFSPRWKSFVVFDKGIDTSEFFNGDFFSGHHKSDSGYLKAAYCFEHIVPSTISEKKRSEYMLNDLNRYFALKKGVAGHLEKKKVICFSLIRTSEIDKVTTVDNSSDSEGLAFVIGNGIIENPGLSNLMFENKMSGKPFFLINETGWAIDTRVKIRLSSKHFESIDELNEVLVKYDIKIVQKELEYNFIVFRKAYL